MLSKMGRSFHNNSLTFGILRTVGQGALALSLLLVPNLGIALKPFLIKKRRSYRESDVRHSVVYLTKQGLISVKRGRTGDTLYITGRGRKQLEARYELKPLQKGRIVSTEQWRVLLFDIPESKGLARRIFQRALRKANYFPLQKSVFVSPISFPDDFHALVKRLDLGRHIVLLTTRSLGGWNSKARKFFLE